MANEGGGFWVEFTEFYIYSPRFIAYIEPLPKADFQKKQERRSGRGAGYVGEIDRGSLSAQAVLPDFAPGHHFHFLHVTSHRKCTLKSWISNSCQAHSLEQTALAYARVWHHVDASDRILGKLAERIALVLMGKHKPIYDPSGTPLLKPN